ncbi:MAG: hypothetical protein IPJ50_01005 [Betaproteobacteria bacterium]|nr:hypothetical protein [Betaproteobacteria bacterium]
MNTAQKYAASSMAAERPVYVTRLDQRKPVAQRIRAIFWRMSPGTPLRQAIETGALRRRLVGGTKPARGLCGILDAQRVRQHRRRTLTDKRLPAAHLPNTACLSQLCPNATSFATGKIYSTGKDVDFHPDELRLQIFTAHQVLGISSRIL